MTGVAAAAPAVPPAALEPLFSRLEARALFACGGACRAWAAAAERELERRCAQQRWRLPGSRRQRARLGSRPWRALYESKAGNMHAAVHLLRRAAQVDRCAMGALRWQIFRSFNRANNPLARPSKRGHATRGYAGYGI